jgi:hypothetical protein
MDIKLPVVFEYCAGPERKEVKYQTIIKSIFMISDGNVLQKINISCACEIAYTKGTHLIFPGR